jgi:cell division protein ZapA
MKQVEVSILGQVYMLGCPEGGEVQLATAVSAVDKEMTAIRDSGRVKARERIAVLAALNLAYQLAEKGGGAERGNANAERAVSPAAAHAAGNGLTDAAHTAHAAELPAAPEAIGALLRRVDAALADDGQLL